MFEEINIEEVPVIEGELVEYYYERFLKKNNHFKEYKFLQDYHLRDLYNIYYSKNYQYLDVNENWYNLLSMFDKTLFKFLTNFDASYCERLLPIFYKHLNKILADIEEERQKQEKQKQEQEQRRQEQEQKKKEKQEKSQQPKKEKSDEKKEENQEGEAKDKEPTDGNSKEGSGQDSGDSSDDSQNTEDNSGDSDEDNQSEEDSQNDSGETDTDKESSDESEEQEDGEDDSDGDDSDEPVDDEDDTDEEEEPNIPEFKPDLNKAQKNINDAFKEVKEEVDKQQKEQRKTDAKSYSVSKSGGEQNVAADPEIVKNLLAKVNFNSESLNNFIKNTIKNFQQHFSQISKVIMEPILQCEEIEEIEGIELLPFVDEFPFLWEEIYNMYKIYACVVDLSLDVSGSMGSMCNINPLYNSFTGKGGKAEMISLFDLGKTLAYKMYQGKYVAETYLFNERIRKVDINQLISAGISGGTDIDNCILMAIQNKRPHLIVTDGYDTIIAPYTSLVYIINVSPGGFKAMVGKNTATVEQMVRNNQIIAFIDNKFLTVQQFDKYSRS